MIAMNKPTGLMACAMLLMGASLCWGQPSKSWYAVAFDGQGALRHEVLSHPQASHPIVTSGGDGEGWYHYPASDRYIMWFYNGPHSTDHITALDMWAFIGAVDFEGFSSYEVSVGWTTEAWTRSSGPPLPADMPTQADEGRLITERPFAAGERLVLDRGTIEPNHSLRTDNANPAWVFVSVSGRNVMVFRWLTHETIPKEGDGTGGNVNDEPGTGAGVCCNRTIGECYLTDDGTCTPAFTYLGDGSACADCLSPVERGDLGDAPVSYGTYRRDEGAFHAIVAGVHLGQGIDGETEGRPGAAAEGDRLDDGVVFLGGLRQGLPVAVAVTVSAPGFINAWLDFNRDGDWDDPDEQILGDHFVTPGENVLSFSVPANSSTGESYARFRFNSNGGLWHSGHAADGEVEDYRVVLEATHQTPAALSHVLPTHQVTAIWRQPALVADPSTALIDGGKAFTSWTQGPLVVDDWTSNGLQAIQGFRWWGVFEGWTVSGMPPQTPVAFHVSLWSDRLGPGSPDVLLWEKRLPHWVWAYSGTLRHTFGQAGNEAVFEFLALLPQDQWFVPEETPHTSYWIGLSPIYADSSQSSHPWSWLTRVSTQGSPAATVTQIGAGDGGFSGHWTPAVGQLALAIRRESDGRDMTFELISHQAVKE